jgi:hypothetical protein
MLQPQHNIYIMHQNIRKFKTTEEDIAMNNFTGYVI